MRIRAIALVAVLALLLTSCGSDDVANPFEITSSPTVPAVVAGVDLSQVEWVDRTDRADLTIQTRDNTFMPGYVIVKVGTPITFLNVGRTEHNALPVDEVSFVGIEADVLVPRGEATISFDEPGVYPYYCSLHGTIDKGMVGAVQVVE